MPALVSFKVGEASPANTFFAIWMARAAGFYEANGLNIEIVPVVGPEYRFASTGPTSPAAPESSCTADTPTSVCRTTP